MREVKLSSKNQIVIARDVREALGVKAGDRLLVVPRGNTVILLRKPKKYSNAIAGMAKDIYGATYLAGAAILGAGLLGIEGGLELEPPAAAPAEEDPTKPPLPTSVHESLAALEEDERLRALLGEEFVTAYLALRRYELQRFDDHVTDWETAEYVELF